MYSFDQIKKNLKARGGGAAFGEDGGSGSLVFRSKVFQFTFSNGGGWGHVSVSLENRCPTWEEMCHFKDIFWPDSEACVQYHPAKSDYVNNHPNCLHLWRPINERMPKPPKNFIGV